MNDSANKPDWQQVLDLQGAVRLSLVRKGMTEGPALDAAAEILDLLMKSPLVLPEVRTGYLSLLERDEKQS